MAGHFARQLSRRTRAASSGPLARSPTSPSTRRPPRCATARLLQDVDVVLLMLGVGDSIRLTPQRTWRRLLCATIDDLSRGLPEGARVLLSEVPPLKDSAGLPEPWRTIAARHGRLLNRVTAEVIASRPAVASVPFPSESVIDLGDPDSAQAARVYATWARAFLTRMLGPSASTPREA
ncbi:hypothetical protein [Clavibacter tessellarius]|uniref:hypothetical protein n=1 Tax=Clavibacter tessellarius TaxID=31965 RepID=UPI00324627BE